MLISVAAALDWAGCVVGLRKFMLVGTVLMMIP